MNYQQLKEALAEMSEEQLNQEVMSFTEAGYQSVELATTLTGEVYLISKFFAEGT